MELSPEALNLDSPKSHIFAFALLSICIYEQSKVIYKPKYLELIGPDAILALVSNCVGNSFLP
jgi:hypothetical protein